MITHEEIENLALLAKLSFSDEELNALTADMDSIIAFADTVNKAEGGDAEFDNINRLANVFREDVVFTVLSAGRNFRKCGKSR